MCIINDIIIHVIDKTIDAIIDLSMLHALSIGHVSYQILWNHLFSGNLLARAALFILENYFWAKWDG